MSRERLISFKDSLAWQECHNLCLIIYRVTESFPSDERFGLTSQLRRASVSTASNIAEAFGRLSKKEKRQFFQTSLGSLHEVDSQLALAYDLGFIRQEDRLSIDEVMERSRRLLIGLIKSVEKFV